MWRRRSLNFPCVYAPAVPCDVTLDVDHHNDSGDFLKEPPAASVSMYYGKTAAFVVLILSQEASKQLASSMESGDDPM